ncbi:hypothetical protein [Aeromicrobium fastidiosum]|uniref:Uncharacterized protein n=1 Tax=Aeromicrobium fastidiosum TaxID=52699 RepID=A0A641AH42_9ACTN|nr:hypothetical protein [Aeromicrobium fastidiosum]KAA1373001.1 hypothetical protein ESP62_018080 [Aeromicrobium fastidiosum]MBP2390973.1 hypothetical protein [Aeromicrobium fastidiosum]
MVLRRPGAADSVVASPGQVARVVLLRGDLIPRGLRTRARRGYFDDYDQVLALLSDDAALLVVPLRLLSHGQVSSASEMREVSGADEFAQACGLALEPGTANDAAMASAPDSALVHQPVRAELRTALWRHIVLLTVTVLSVLAMLSTDGVVGQIASVLGTVAVAVLAADQWRYRARFLDLVRGRPSSPDRTDVLNLLDERVPRQLREARLQIGADDVVHVVGATETWVAGPHLGGAQRCIIGPDVIAFVDRRGVHLMLLEASSWTTDSDRSALTDACRRHGIEVTTVRAALASPEYLVSHRLQASAGTLDSPASSAAADGEIVPMGPFATALVAMLIALGHIAPFDDLDAFRASVALVAGLAAAVAASAQLRHRRWNREQIRSEGE